MKPKITPTSSTAIWSDITPRWRGSRLLRWFLVSTGSCELRLIRAGRRTVRTVLIAFLLFLHLLFPHRRQERFGEIGQLGFLVLRDRLDEVRRDHHQQFIGRFLIRDALEEVADDRDIA